MRLFKPVLTATNCRTCGKSVEPSDPEATYSRQTTIVFTDSKVSATYCSNRCVNSDDARLVAEAYPLKKGTLVRVRGNRYVWAVVAKVGPDYVLGRKHGERIISGSYRIELVTPIGKPVGTKAQEKESRLENPNGPVQTYRAFPATPTILDYDNALSNYRFMREHAPTESARRVWTRRIERLSK